MSDSHSHAAPPIAELRHIRFSYDHGATWALDDVSLTIQPGERICLVGPNGSGKSTLARLIAGLTAPDGGDITLLGHHVFGSDSGPDADAYRAARRGIGMVFQNPEDQIVTTIVEDDIAFGPENLGIPREDIGMRIATTLESVGLSSHRDSDPTRMSGGQQQRTAIAGMLAMNSRILVLDEPTAMLDETARGEVMAILDTLQTRGTTIIHVTHRPVETLHADRVVHMEGGHITTIAEPHSAEPHSADGADAAGPDTVGIACTDSTVGTVAAWAAPISPLPLLGQEESAAMSPAIQVRHLSYRYGSGRTVIRDLSFHINAGTTVALMGANGSGKSTLALLLCALAKPVTGSIEVAGVPVASVTANACTRRNGKPRTANRKQLAALRRHVGYVMQHPEHQLFADTVAEDVAYGPRNQGLDDSTVQERVKQALEMLHIAHLADRSPFDLSGGQQRLVAIAGVVACQPDVLIMDEPTASLDVHAASRIHELIRTLKAQGVTMLIVTHDRAEAYALADRVVRMPDAHDISAEPDNVHDSRVQTGSPDARGTRPMPARQSLMQQLDPRAKMVCFLAAMFTMFAVNTPVQLGLGIALTLGMIAAARLNPLRLIAAIHPILALLALMSLANLVVVRTGPTLVAWGPFSITGDGVTIAVLYTCRFALVIIMGAVFLNTTTPTAMTDAFASLLKPLRHLGMHTQEIALVMSLALRFIPTLTSETTSIINAQAARGGTVETGSLPQRVKAMCAIIVPVFAGTLRHADNLSLALDARCYEEGITRTHWRTFAPHPRDAVFATIIVCYISAIIAMNIIA
ncbi:ATP-binding cassette domain-containing protein [Bifidobacterium reuteri]|uniref:ATP-binding cassette domain-containing protein n=1 Tax=Bifidobacterium reuteri TaxID=983706 RepID=A0A5J5EA65_9BIFI|nr:energy-coupling factor transporter ATPase [Bifidobacterium reuteri]KAA8826376.1 ATP-binding cassette domain-containing protein [Bifidobacterium reuteri]